MVDFLAPALRSEHMKKIKSSNTKPELLVRYGLHALGYRFRVRGIKLPGKPDIVFCKKRRQYLFMVAFGIIMKAALWPTYRKLGLNIGKENLI